MIIKTDSRPQFKLTEFEGPLDLLLHLVKKNKMSIFDISTAQITEQYLQYVNILDKQNLEDSSEFLLVASQLLRIKSSKLLPSPSAASKSSEGESDHSDEAELIKRLEEYEKIKNYADIMKDMSGKSQPGVFKPPENIKNKFNNMDIRKITADDLLSYYRNLINKINSEEKEKLRVTESVKSDVKITVLQKIKDILKILRKESLSFYKFFSCINCRQEKVSAFLAVLELIRQNRIKLQSLSQEIFITRMSE